MRARCRPAVRRGAVEVRARRGLVALLKREDPEELLSAPELIAARGDPPQVRRGLTWRALRQVQLGEHQHVGVTKRAERMRVLQRDDCLIRLADPPKQLRTHVVRTPRPRLCLDDALERACGSLLVAALDGLSRKDEEPVFGAGRVWIQPYGGNVLVECVGARRVGGARIAGPKQRRVRLVLEAGEESLVRGLVGGLGLQAGRRDPERLG